MFNSFKFWFDLKLFFNAVILLNALLNKCINDRIWHKLWLFLLNRWYNFICNTFVQAFVVHGILMWPLEWINAVYYIFVNILYVKLQLINMQFCLTVKKFPRYLPMGKGHRNYSPQSQLLGHFRQSSEKPVFRALPERPGKLRLLFTGGIRFPSTFFF